MSDRIQFVNNLKDTFCKNYGVTEDVIVPREYLSDKYSRQELLPLVLNLVLNAK